jgi:hypothetical protein
MKALVLLSLLAQAMVFPPAGDPYWETGRKSYIKVAIEIYCHNSTTMDGLPNCNPQVVLTSKHCLKLFPPDEVGGFCDWYGFSTVQQENRFEYKRGFKRLRHADGSGDTWVRQ